MMPEVLTQSQDFNAHTALYYMHIFRLMNMLVVNIPVASEHRPYKKMDNTSPLAPTVQKCSQSILNMGAAILCW